MGRGRAKRVPGECEYAGERRRGPGSKQHSALHLERKLSSAEVEEVLQGGAEQVQNHDAVIALHAEPPDIGDAGCGEGGARSGGERGGEGKLRGRKRPGPPSPPAAKRGSGRGGNFFVTRRRAACRWPRRECARPSPAPRRGRGGEREAAAAGRECNSFPFKFPTKCVDVPLPHSLPPCRILYSFDSYSSCGCFVFTVSWERAGGGGAPSQTGVHHHRVRERLCSS